MIAPSLFLIRWEWFKLRRRWMPWILLAVILAFTQIPYWAAFTLAGVFGGLREELLLPNSVAFGLSFGYTAVMVSAVIWTAAAIGAEYNLGTFRTMLVQGTGRWQFLASLFVLMAATGVAWLLAMCLAMGVSGLLAGVLHGGAMFAPGGQWTPLLEEFGKSALALAPYIAMTMFFAVLTTSGGTASSITLVYRFLVEGILVPILTQTVDQFEAVSDYVLGRAVSGWLSGGEEGDAPLALAFGGADVLPGAVHSLLVILAYTAILLAASLWLFQRRDIGGARGI